MEEFARKLLVEKVEPSASAWLEMLKKKRQRGQIGKLDDMQTARSYTLSYSYTHFDALTKLINERLKPHLNTLQGRLLHIALGCGPGTDSWAVIHTFDKSVNVKTIGYDHNRNMIRLARNIAERLVRNSSHKYKYSDSPHEFERKLYRDGGQVALVTANALFGQNNMTDEFVIWAVGLIDRLADKKARVFVIGTHPKYSGVKVDKAWERIVAIQGAVEIYEDSLDIRPTWSATNYGNWRHSEDGPWSRVPTKEQLARIIRVQR